MQQSAVRRKVSRRAFTTLRMEHPSLRHARAVRARGGLPTTQWNGIEGVCVHQPLRRRCRKLTIPLKMTSHWKLDASTSVGYVALRPDVYYPRDTEVRGYGGVCGCFAVLLFFHFLLFLIKPNRHSNVVSTMFNRCFNLANIESILKQRCNNIETTSCA